MHQQELHGNIRHRTEVRWQRVGRGHHGERALLIDGEYYSLGGATGSHNNCLIDTLRQCLNMMANVEAVRLRLMREFDTRCGPLCRESGENCTATCTKVYRRNYLTTDHWEAALRLLGEHGEPRRLTFDTSQFCLRVIELTWQDHGVVLGNPNVQRRLTVAREHGNHFIPVLRYTLDVRNTVWLPW